MGITVSFPIDFVGLISRSWNCFAPHKGYVCKLKENLDALRTAITELTELKNDVKGKVETAEVQQQLKSLDQVQGWLSRVEIMEADVEKLIADGSKEIEEKCLGCCCCPKNCPSTYKIGKKVAKKLEEVTILKSQGNFEVVAGKQLLASGSAAERSSSEPVGLEATFSKVQSYIGDEGVGIIGIYGMGGVGKTTLLTQINNNFLTNFVLVIWVVVSRNSTTVKVQDGIGRKIGFHDDSWKNKSQEEKATCIFGVLKRKRFLLLLDDIWERINLLEVGVPSPNKHKSKVVFTTRSEDVCGRMGAEKQIKIECLGQEKAWELFQDKVGKATLNSHPEIPEKAKIVAKECKGLPLALITIGLAMARKKTPQEWDHAGQVLKENAAKFSDMEDEVLPILKYSYESLRSNKTRSCFLYCSLFPEDYLISKERLIEYWIGEGYLNGFNDINEGYDIIGTLIRACLLEEDSSYFDQTLDFIPNGSGRVKMHDVIRDMALWIAGECGEVDGKFWVQARSDLRKAPEIGKWKGVEKMSLMYNEIEELAETPLCPNLSTLFLNDNGRHLTMITHGFFQNMPNLKVLDLSGNVHLEELPVEISELVLLQYLNLESTRIRKLPIEYKNLVELKYFNLENTNKLDRIPQGLLSSFKKLSVLKMYRSTCLFDSSEEDGILYAQIDTFVKEVESLEELNHLSLSVKTASTLSRVLRSPKVQSCTKLLSLIQMKDSKYQDMSFLQSMRCLHKLVFIACNTLEDLKVERAREGMANLEIIESRLLCFHNLHCVVIRLCKKLKEVTWLIFAPNLESLHITSCPKMEEVICGGKWGEASAAEEGGYLKLFAQLKKLTLSNLPQLRSMYPNALSFPCLESIKVTECPNLKKLPLNFGSTKGCTVEIKGNEKWWNELVWDNEATKNVFVRVFKQFEDEFNHIVTEREMQTISVWKMQLIVRQF